jgi:hypothetical protein
MSKRLFCLPDELSSHRTVRRLCGYSTVPFHRSRNNVTTTLHAACFSAPEPSVERRQLQAESERALLLANRASCTEYSATVLEMKWARNSSSSNWRAFDSFLTHGLGSTSRVRNAQSRRRWYEPATWEATTVLLQKLLRSITSLQSSFPLTRK